MKYCPSQKSDITVRFFYQSTSLPEEWRQLIPKDHFLESEQLALYEQMSLPDVSFLYALISRNDKYVAAAYFQVLCVKDYHLDTSGLSAIQALGWKMFTHIGCPKLLIAGHLFRHDIASFYYSDTLTPFDAFRCYQEAITQAINSSRVLAALIKDMPEGLSVYVPHYAPEYLLQRNDISMEMSLPDTWTSIADYEKALKHKYAQRFRKIRSLWGQLTIRELSVAETEANKQLLFQLYEQVSNKQQVRLGLLNESFLPLLKKQFPDELKIWIAYKEDKAVAFFSAWSRAEVFDMFYIGFDYAYNEELQLYFNILFFSIEQAIATGKSRLILGRTALEAKARLGCKPRYLSTFVCIRNKYLRNFVQQLQQKASQQEGEWENRHPFKGH